MRVRFWGTRGSIATPGPGTNHFGGNTSCVEVQADDGTLIVLDCGTGAHDLGGALLGAALIGGTLAVSAYAVTNGKSEARAKKGRGRAGNAVDGIVASNDGKLLAGIGGPDRELFAPQPQFFPSHGGIVIAEDG